MIAVVLGLTSAFAFKAPAKSFTTYWFHTDSSGAPTTYDPDGPACLQKTGIICAKEYSASQLNFSGMTPVSVKTGQQNNQIQIEQLGD